MKITFVGTSHGVPSAERHCSCAMIESGNSVYFVDAGAPMTEAILKAGRRVENVKAVFTTHVHSDHTVGMIQLASLMNWYYGKASADFFVTEQDHIDATKNWIFTAGDGEIDENRIRFKRPTQRVVYEDENIKASWDKYLEIKNELYPAGGRPVTLMDLATIGAKYLKRTGKLKSLDESEEITF